jgi:hypothetical protein
VTNSPALAGTPTAPTPIATDNSTKLATTAYVQTAITPAVYNNVGRNLLLNPMLLVQQRGQGPWTTTSYTADGWQMGWNAATDTNTVNIITLTDADRAAIGDEAAIYAFQTLTNGSATAGGYSQLGLHVEGVRPIAGKTVTVSFWARANSGTPAVGVGLDQIFGTGGTPSGLTSVNGTAVALSTTWTRYHVTMTIPSAAGKTVGTNGDDSTQVTFWFSSSATYAARSGIGVQSNTFFLWGVQCEIGTVMTQLEKLNLQIEFAKCQRYYQTGAAQLNSYGAAGGSAVASWALPVAMRAPSGTINANFTTQSNCSGSSFLPMSGGYMQLITTVTVTAGFAVVGTFNASAEF